MARSESITSSRLVLASLLWLVSLHCVHCMGCSDADEAFLKQRRIESLRANILAQLGMADISQETANSTNTTDEPPSEEDENVRQAYEALVNATKGLESSRSKACQPQDFYAKPVTSFIGSMTPDFITKDLTRQRRVVEDPTSPSPTPTPPSLPPGILSSYKINLEFNLADDLKDISRADLLLYQLPTLTGANIEPRDYQQFVEIRTVIGDLEERHVVEGKYINTFDTGYKVFEITNAVKLWVLRNIRGNVTLEVVIYCYRSPNCASQGPDGKFPAKVEFLYAANETERAPRVIIISTNPLEHKDSGKYKRSTHSTTPDFCADDESMCCLKPLTIDFKRDLGIYSIVQPTTLDANYCEGICPQISGLGVMTPQRFEFLRHLGSSHPAASIEPCCAGATYRSLEVLMRKRNPLTGVFYSQIETLQQVEVTSCRCA